MNRWTIKLSPCLLAFILSLTAASAVVAQEEAIPESEARFLAGLNLIERLVLETPGLEHWNDLTLGEGALLYDPAAIPAAWEFEIRQRGEPAGRIRVAASSWIGSVGIFLGTSPLPTSIEAALEGVATTWLAENRGGVIESLMPIMLSGSKLGARLEVRRSGRLGTQVEYRDLFRATPLPAPPPGAPPGQTQVGSYYYHLDDESLEIRRASHELERAISFWEGWDLIFSGIDVWMARPLTRFDVAIARERLQYYVASEKMNTVATWRCRLITQKTPDDCVAAVAQMIDWYHYGYVTGWLRHSQATIRYLLDLWGFSDGSGRWRDAMQRYFRSQLGMTDTEYDTAIDSPYNQLDAFTNLEQQIDDGFPPCDGVGLVATDHARMVMAYHVYDHGPFKRYELGIYDPEPFTGGIFWELGWKESSFGLVNVARRYFVLNVRQ